MSPSPTRYELAARLRVQADSAERLAADLDAFRPFAPYNVAGAELTSAAEVMRRRAQQIMEQP